MNNTKDKHGTISDAIAHLNGYVEFVESGVGYPALAVRNTIKELKELLE